MSDPSAPSTPAPATPAPHTAFVLGGGGMLGGYQVGMLRALLEHGVRPDLIVGTSVGSIQGAMLAADPTPAVVRKLNGFWNDAIKHKVMGVPPRGLLANLARLRPALADQEALKGVLDTHLGARTRIEQLAVPFQAAAASIERSTARYFDHGPLIPALLASSCVPGLWPPRRIGDEHYIDGGVVETVPVARALSYGAKEIWVLRLRQRELPLRAPRRPWQLGQTVFEVSRRHQLGQVVNMRPDGVAVHLLPTGEDLLEPPDTGLHTTVAEQLEVYHRRVEAGYRSTLDYLEATDERKTATIRARTRPVLGPVRTHHLRHHRHTAGAAGEGDDHNLIAVPPPASPFVRAKLGRFFDLFDTDGDGRAAGLDHVAAGERVAAAFGHAPDSHAATRLRESLADFWTALCRDAGGSPLSPLGRDAYVDALGRLTSDPAGYDGTVLPTVNAVLDAADQDHDAVLNHAELGLLLTALGVAAADVPRAALRLDTNNDGVLSIDELDEAFRDFFTSEEPSAPGNLLFGGRDTPADRPGQTGESDREDQAGRSKQPAAGELSAD